MESSELQPNGSTNAPQDIVVTAASAETAARAKQSQNSPRSHNTVFKTIIIACAIFVSLVWPLSVLAFVQGLMGWQGLTDAGPHIKVIIAAAALFPLPAFWFGALNWIRTRDLIDETRRLTEIANKLMYPEETAVNEIASVGQAMRREVESLSSGVEVALDRVRALEGAVAKQALTIEDAAAEAELKTSQIHKRLEKERHVFAEVADNLAKEVKTYSLTVTSKVDEITTAADESQSKMTEVTDKLAAHGNALSETATSAIENSQEASRELERQTSKLESVSDAALARADVIAGRYDRQRTAIAEAAEKLGDENTRLEVVMENQREVLGQISNVIADQSGLIQTSIADCATNLQSALDDAVVRARKAAGEFQDDLEAAAANSEDSAANISKAAEKASIAAEQARTLLDAETDRARKAIQEQALYSKEMVNGLFHAFEENYRGKAEGLRATFEEETRTFRHKIEEANRIAQSTLDERSRAASHLIEQTTAEVGKASERLNGVLTNLQKTSEDSGRLFGATTDVLDRHMATLPARAEETALRIRQILDEELEAFSRLAGDAGRKIQTLVAAYNRHLPAGVGMRTVPQYAEPPSSPYQAAGIGPRDFQSPTTPPTTSEPDKGSWAWRDVLASLDTPDKGTSVKGTKTERTPTTPVRSKAELDQSSLRVFEALQSMAIDIDRALEADPPADLLRRYLNGEKTLFTKRLLEMTSQDLVDRIRDRYLEDAAFRDHVNHYIDQFEGLLGEAVARDSEDILIETFMSSHTGKVYLLLGSAVGHFG